jgi:hypothetical protein
VETLTWASSAWDADFMVRARTRAGSRACAINDATIHAKVRRKAPWPSLPMRAGSRPQCLSRCSHIYWDCPRVPVARWMQSSGGQAGAIP